MTDLLQTGSQWLEGMRHSHASHSVTYHRDAANVTLNATVGTSTFEIATTNGIEPYETRDFLVRTADLILSGSPVTPARGDRIKEVLNGDTVIYEVMSPGTEPPWRYSDGDRLTMRIHTKQVDTE